MTEKAKTKKPKAPLLSFKYLPTDFIRVTGVLPGLLWLRPKYVYENENAKKKIKGAAIAIANHSTFYDPVYISFALWYRRHRFVVKKEIYDSKAHTLLKWGRCIPIDPENAGLDSVKAVTAALKEGELVTMFPEGQVSHSQTDFKQFKSGVVLMAFKGKAPIVPIFITMEDSDHLDGDGFFVQEYTLHILPAIYPDPSLPSAEAKERMKQQNYEAWVKVYEDFYQKPLVYGES